MNREFVLNILLVEDNPADVRLTREAFKELEVKNTIHVVENGEQALAYVRQQDPYSRAARPNLILLDLNLPKKDGRQVLAELKAHPDLRRIPVIILSSSRADDDVRSAYDHHANCYITKPVSFDDFLKVTRSIEQFWLTLVSLPDPRSFGQAAGLL